MDNQSLENSIENLSQVLKELANGRNASGLQDGNHIEFVADKGKKNYGKGLVFKGHGTTKQLTLAGDPDRFILTENVDLGKDKALMINKVKILDQNELGASVTKSSLRELGKLRGLIVDGSMSAGQDFYFDSKSGRLGLGTEEPNSKLSIIDKNVEIIIGADDSGRARIGTYSNQDLDFVVGHNAKISLKANNCIDIGNPNSNPSTVKVHGKLSVGVKMPDANVDLHVAGAVRLNNRLQIIAESPPSAGNYNVGDMIWNSSPRAGGILGWICTRAGDPGVWNRFGDIK